MGFHAIIVEACQPMSEKSKTVPVLTELKNAHQVKHVLFSKGFTKEDQVIQTHIVIFCNLALYICQFDTHISI